MVFFSSFQPRYSGKLTSLVQLAVVINHNRNSTVSSSSNKTSNVKFAVNFFPSHVLGLDCVNMKSSSADESPLTPYLISISIAV